MRTESQRWGRRILVILLGVFGVVIGVNVLMVSIATGTFSGTTAVNPYEQGLAYNSTLEDKRRQDALGWTVVRVQEVFPQTLRYMVAGKDGNPVTGAVVVTSLTRPVGNEAAETVTLKESKPGVYEAAVTWPGMGRWDIKTEIRQGEATFSMDERVMVR